MIPIVRRRYTCTITCTCKVNFLRVYDINFSSQAVVKLNQKVEEKIEKTRMRYPTESIDDSMAEYFPKETCMKTCTEDAFQPETNLVDPNTSFLPTSEDTSFHYAKIDPGFHVFLLDEDDTCSSYFKNDDSKPPEARLVSWEKVSSQLDLGATGKEPQETTNYCWKPSETVEDQFQDLEISMNENNESLELDMTIDEKRDDKDLAIGESKDGIDITIDEQNDSSPFEGTQTVGVLVYGSDVDTSTGSRPIISLTSLNIDAEIQNGNKQLKVKSVLPEEDNDEDEKEQRERKTDNEDGFMEKHDTTADKSDQDVLDPTCKDKETKYPTCDLNFNMVNEMSIHYIDEEDNGTTKNEGNGKGYLRESDVSDGCKDTSNIRKRVTKTATKFQKTPFLEEKKNGKIKDSTIKLKEKGNSKSFFKRENQKRNLNLGNWIVFMLVLLAVPSTHAARQICTDPYDSLSISSPNFQGDILWSFIPYGFRGENYPKGDDDLDSVLQHSYMILLILVFAVLTDSNQNRYYDIDIRADDMEFRILVSSDESVNTVFRLCQAMMVNDGNGRERPQGFLRSASFPFLSPRWNLNHVLQAEMTNNQQARLTFVVVP